MRAHWILVSVVGAFGASLCHAQSQVYRFNTQASPGDKYGWSVASAGDTDGDGQPDILVGAPFDDTGGTSAGAAFLYSGRTGALLHSWFCSVPHALFGWSVDGVDDLDGDGRSDILIGAPLEHVIAADMGAIYVYSGASGGLLTTRPGPQPDCQFGTVVRGLGDIDGDGRGDFAASIPGYDVNPSNQDAGAVCVYSGTAPIMFMRRIDGLHAGDNFGYSVEPVLAAGDLLSSRLAIGAVHGGATDQGQVRLYDLMGNVRSTITGTQTDGWFGASIARIGDLDGDGSSELAIGEPYADYNGTDTGRVTVCNQVGTVLHIFVGSVAGERFGETVSALGDYNGDGVVDFLVGRPAADPAGMTDAGHVSVLSTNTGAQIGSWFGQTNDSFGRGLACADLNLDGTPDALIGAPSNTSGNGDAWAFLSRAPLSSTYCAAKPNSLACVPQIYFTGAASLSVADNFHVTARTLLNNKVGLAIWSHGSATTPFNGSILCVQAPVYRTPGQSSGGSPIGSDCTGSYDFPFTQAYLLSKGVVAGDTLYAQVWSRDPGFAAPQNFGLTDGLRFVVVP